MWRYFDSILLLTDQEEGVRGRRKDNKKSLRAVASDPSTVDHVAGRESSSIMHALFWAHRLERDNAGLHQKATASCEDISLFNPILLPDQVEGDKTSG